MAHVGSDYKTQVLQATDIVELISQTVALKRRGKDFVGLCPFHQEKTPSFHVSPSKQFFHCYGCKAGGNAIDFVIKRDRVEFIEALKVLGEKAGIEMPKFGVSRQQSGERQILLEAQSAACALFENLLNDPQKGAAARQYLQKRGFSAEIVRQFQVGVAPDAWDGLLRSSVGRKFTPQQLLAAGLVKARENGGGFYDTFRNRLMFPIKDEQGRIIAFGGRVMPGSEDPAKYLNSPETPLFSKSRSIFALDQARQAIVESRTAIICEGYTDAIMSHQFGVRNVVSCLGTALTEQHVSVLRRFADRIILLFDADTAGDTAAARSVELFLTQPIDILVATMPEGVDPDELLLQQGADGFRKVLENAADALSFQWKQLQRQYSGTSDLTGQQKALEQYLQTLSAARASGPVDAMRWGAVLARVSRLSGIPIEQLHRHFRTARTQGPAQRPQQPAPVTAAPGAPLTAQTQAEARIVGILLAEPKYWQQAQQHVGPQDMSDAAHRKLAELLWDQMRHEGAVSFSEFLGLIEEPGLKDRAIELVEAAGVFAEAEATLNGSVDHLRWLAWQRRQREELNRAEDETEQLRQMQALALKVSERNKNL